MPDNDPRKNGGGSASYGRYIGVGFTFLLVTAGSAVVGFFLDRLFGTLPLFLMIGLLAGFVGGLYYLYLILKRLENG